jgi:glycerol-3-phosphate acyltransferase PlsY
MEGEMMRCTPTPLEVLLESPETVLLTALVLAVAAYFLGCFNGAVIVSKYILRDDVRNHGSGNAGLTNFYRTFGGPLTFAVIMTDVFKAVIAVELGVFLTHIFFSGIPEFPLYGKYWAALWCLLGHMFPCMFRFKGGKGILSGGTIAIMIDWRIALVVWGGFLILAALTRYVSLGSVWAGASFPFATWVCYPDPFIVVLGFAIGGLVVWQHRENIRRLFHGNENKFSFHRRSEGKS